MKSNETKRNHNKKELETLISQEKNSLYRMAFLHMKNENDTLDVVQETVYKAYKSINDLKDTKYLLTWLTRILINTALNFIKTRNRELILPFNNFEKVTGKADNKIEERMDLFDAINQLDEHLRTVVFLRYYRDFSIKQIAYTLNCPEGTIKSQLHRALTKLKTDLKEDFAK